MRISCPSGSDAARAKEVHKHEKESINNVTSYKQTTTKHAGGNINGRNMREPPSPSACGAFWLCGEAEMCH